MSDLRQFFNHISANVKQMKEKQQSTNIIQRKYGKIHINLIYRKNIKIQTYTKIPLK